MIDPEVQQLIQDQYKIGQVYRVVYYEHDSFYPYIQRYLILADPLGIEEPGVDTIVKLEPKSQVAVSWCFLWQDKLWNGAIPHDLDEFFAKWSANPNRHEARLHFFHAGSLTTRPADKAYVYLVVNYISDLPDLS